MRFNHKYNQLIEILFSISILLIINLIKICDSVINGINGSQTQSALTLNQISATNRPQHYDFCGEPPIVANAQSNLMRNQKHNVFKVGEIATYSCDQGFTKLSGKEQSQCLARDEREAQRVPHWQPLDLICEIVKCIDPGFVANSTRKTNGFLYNTNVIYECYPGFRMIGVPFLTCRSNGKWNRDKPWCQMKRCPELNNLENGRIVYSDLERKTDSKLEYTCDPGFKLNVENAIRYCRQDDSWSPLPDINDTFLQCLVVKCETPIRPHSGLRILPSRPKSGSFFKPGDVIIFSCDTNNKIKASAKCLADGMWSRGPPHCPERDTICPPIGEFPNGFYNVTNRSTKDFSSYKSGTRLGFYCEEKYILDGSTSLVCLSSGVWNASIPKCAFNDSLHQSQSSQLTILITSIAILVMIVFFISCVLVCRWRQQQLQRRRWQQYFGHYNHRQSKTNIMLNTNEMKCFRQTPPKPTVPVTDL